MEVLSDIAAQLILYCGINNYALSMLSIVLTAASLYTMYNFLYAFFNEEESRRECDPYSAEIARQIAEMTVVTHCHPSQLPPPAISSSGAPLKHVLIMHADN